MLYTEDDPPARELYVTIYDWRVYPKNDQVVVQREVLP